MRQFRSADINDDINDVENVLVNTKTTGLQSQINADMDEPSNNIALKPNAQMLECIRKVQYYLLPHMASGDVQITGEFMALYTSLVRCITEFEHSEHALRAIQHMIAAKDHFQIQRPDIFGVVANHHLLAQDEIRLNSFREMTYVLREISQLPSIQNSSIESFVVRLVDQCEAAAGQDVSDFYI